MFTLCYVLLDRRKLLLDCVDRLLEEHPNAEVFFSSF